MGLGTQAAYCHSQLRLSQRKQVQYNQTKCDQNKISISIQAKQRRMDAAEAVKAAAMAAATKQFWHGR